MCARESEGASLSVRAAEFTRRKEDNSRGRNSTDSFEHRARSHSSFGRYRKRGTKLKLEGGSIEKRAKVV